MLQLGVSLVQELLGIDDATLVQAPSDLADFIEGSHFKGDDLAFHSNDSGFRMDFQTHGGGGGMLDIQHGADGSFRLLQGTGDGFAGSAFHQGNHTGGSIHQQVTGADFHGGIGPLHIGVGGALHANSNFHSYHNLSA